MSEKERGGKTVYGTIYTPTQLITFTTIYIKSVSCDSIFLLKQKSERVEGTKKKLRSYTTRYLLCGDSTCKEKLTPNEILLLEKVISVSKEFSVCNVDINKSTGYRFIGKKRTWAKYSAD